MKVKVFENMIRRTIKTIDGSIGSDKMVFKTASGNTFTFTHHQECCESVYIQDIIGDINDIVGSPLIMAEEITSMDELPTVPSDVEDDSCTWTFYKFGTVKGEITIRWLGTSNGYYSESVNYEEVFLPAFQ